MTQGQPKRLSVAAYVIVGFGAVILALGVVLTTTTTTSFRREQLKSVAELRVAAQYTGDSEAATLPQTTEYLDGIAADPRLTSFDAAQCEAMMETLAPYATQANAYLLAPDGRVVCSLSDPGKGAFALPAGDWLGRTRARASETVVTTAIDPKTGHPLTAWAVAVPPGATNGGAMVAVQDLSSRPLVVPANTSHGVELMELDSTRKIVLAASENAGHKPGAVPAKSWMRHPLGSETTRRDADGVVRLYQEVYVAGVGHYFLAAMPKHMALVEARHEMQSNLLVAAAVVVLVSLLGMVMQRRIAKPIKTLKDVIVAAAEDHVVKAVPEGPAEVAAVARAFNTTMHERRQLEGDLAHALKEAQRASKLKSEFLANMSHEIRTPMNGVLGMLSLLEDASVSDEVRDCLRTMGDSAGALMSILNELLDFSKLEAGMLATEQVPFNVREIVRGAISPWVAMAGRKNVPLVASVESAVPDEVRGDPTRVRQILSNLIDNAVKFTNKGRITVTAKKLPGETLRFEVKDDGIGISDESRSQLFEPFVQADGTTTRRYGGTGLGLAICRQLAEFMGGRIGVESTLGDGSTFWFELPLPAVKPSHEDPSAPAPAPVANADVGAGASVLVVDDNLVNQKVAVQMLRKLGYEVTVASDGVEALRAIDAGFFDVVMMDVQMPVMDGWEATSELRRRGRAIPVIAMTASALEEDRKRCVAVGMDGYVVKPMNLDSLSGELTRVLAQVRDTAPAASAF